MMKNKRGRKSNVTYGYNNECVKTWALFDGEWIYQGLCNKRVVGIISDGTYNYYTVLGIEKRQDA